ncbi:MAG: PBP1A family penicillin-binding protein [Christensenellales bacterium]|jgi:penicillin-binding protein 1A
MDRIEKLIARAGNAVNRALTGIAGFFRRSRSQRMRRSARTAPRVRVAAPPAQPGRSRRQSRLSAQGLIAGIRSRFSRRETPPVDGAHVTPAVRRPVSIFCPRTRKRNALLAVVITTGKLAILLTLILGFSGLGAVLGVAKAYVDTTPVLDISKIEDQAETSFIYDVNGELITTFTGLENRMWAKLDEIPQMLQDAIIAIEDVRFYSHNGIDPKRIIGSLFSNLRTGSTQGGSTITTQLIKMRLLSSEQTYKRKLQEAYLAIQLEKQYKKVQILEAYLNTVPLGGSNYGVKAAAQDYFGKELSELTLRECAMLAGIPQSPYAYNPRLNMYSRNNMELTDKRTNSVLLQMYKNGFINEEQYERALGEKVFILEHSPVKQMYDMPYFVEYVIYDVVTHLLEQRKLVDNSTNRNMIENELRTSGYKIYTTVDPEIQLALEDTIYNWPNYPEMANEKDSSVVVLNPDGTTQQIAQPQAAAVVYDYHTGEIKAMVGGRYQPTTKKSFNRAYQSRMDVGSSIKPLTVYGPALDIGYSPASILYNIPLAIEGWATEQGYPSNYGGGGFTGTITLRESLIESVNNSTARLLLTGVTLDEAYNYLVSLGVKSPINKTGSGLALGTTGITPLEMAAAFGAIANNGAYSEPFSFTKVVDSHGAVLIDTNEIRIKRQVFKPTTSWLLVDLLVDAVRNGTGGRAAIDGMTVGGKTGTNSDQRGVFFAGFTPYYSASVWIGSDHYDALYARAQGGRDAAPLWKAFMERIHGEKGLADRPIHSATAEEMGLIRVEVCTISGRLATDACREDGTTTTDYFVAGTEPIWECDAHRYMEYCAESGKLATLYCPAEGVEQRVIVTLPDDSPLMRLKDADLLKYVPNVFKEYALVSDPEFTAESKRYHEFYCDRHTLEWYEHTQHMDSLRQDSEALIESVERKMDDSDYMLLDSDRKLLEQDIAALRALLAQKDAPLQALRDAYETLRARSGTLLVKTGG